MLGLLHEKVEGCVVSMMSDTSGGRISFQLQG